MYNEERKKQFLELIEGVDHQNFITLFKQTEPLEAEEDDDLYNIPIEISLE